MSRPEFIKHWTELEAPDAHSYQGDTEPMGLDAPLSTALGITRVGIHHVRLLPGRRTSYPHAESTEQEFVFVLQGKPDVWIDGVLHAIAEGDCVAFPAGTGICHTFINNTQDEVRLMVVGEPTRADNLVRFPLNEAYERTRVNRWVDWPTRPLGGHDGKPD
ncbi:MAG: cupin domain-containing protein [Achromobacter sp.]|uniref:cupin domain-containing protein n=1 Tax=Achromobacter sp. TaxID=134375 RepID=UPI0029B9D996|nr:cupin domain-containing protein [Achromobacter sp.]MDX3987065.1 cupin domain-containing protein [Achromobacter sp.]